MVFQKDALTGKDSRFLGFLTREEAERRRQLLDELSSLEEAAMARYRRHLQENTDRELSALAAALPENEDFFKRAFREKLAALIKDYGKFAFVIWDWKLPAYEDLTSGWAEAHEYEVETGRDFHCTVLSDSARSEEWAREVFENFYSLEDVKRMTGLNSTGETVDKIVYSVARELIPVKYE